jgi:uncharacterized DUF497 family protein
MADDPSFDWNAANLNHIARHRIGPADVAQAFANETIDLNYEVSEGEERWTSVGHTDGLRIIVIVWTMRGDAIRTVTASMLVRDWRNSTWYRKDGENHEKRGRKYPEIRK